MKFDIPKPQGKRCPAGTHAARCIQFIDLGTQESPNFEPSRKVRVTWETPEETDTFKEGEEERPFTISKEYSLSMNTKSNFRKDLESWRGKPFTEAEATSFDTSAIIGKACFITVQHTEKGANTYANVTAVSGVPRGMTIKEQVGASIVYGTQEGRNVVFESLPEWLRKKIETSPEFQLATEGQVAITPNADGADEVDEVADSDIPF